MVEPLPLALLLCCMAACATQGTTGASMYPQLPDVLQSWRKPGEGSMHYWQWDDLSSIITGDRTFHNVRPLLRKLEAGQPVQGIGIGSSVTQDQGGCWIDGDRATVAQRVGMAQAPDWGDSRCQTMPGFLWQFMGMINRTWPHRGHTLVNLGRASIDMQWFASMPCLHDYLPTPLDFVVIELLPIDTAATLEAVFTRFFDIARWNAAALPAIFLGVVPYVVDWNRYPMARDTLLAPENCAARYPDRDDNTSFPHMLTGAFFRGAPNSQNQGSQEAQTHRLAQYYGFPFLTPSTWLAGALRDGVHTAKNMTTCKFLADFTSDGLHLRGSQMQLWAEGLMGVLHLARQQLRANPGLAHVYATLPSKPLWGWPRVTHVCVRSQPGMLEGAMSVEAGPGWQWVDMQEVEQGSRQQAGSSGQPGGAAKPRKRKPGWLARTPGSSLNIQLPTNISTTSAQVTLLHLASYRHMGQARVTCTWRCSCEPSVFDGHLQHEKISVARYHTFTVTPHHECKFQVTVLDTTSSGEHKVKVLGVRVSAAQAGAAASPSAKPAAR